MLRAHSQLAFLAAVVAAVIFGSRPVAAMNPSIIMIYGDTIQTPLIFPITRAVGYPSPYLFLWDMSPFHAVNVKNVSLTGRRYVKLAMFWDYRVWQRFIDDPDSLRELKPEQASQHARLYLPSGSKPAIVIATAPTLEVPPIPSQIGDFKTGWVLSAADLEAVRTLGIPGL